MSKSILVHIEPDAGTVKLTGRAAWALRKLADAGPRGCTPLEAPALRWSHYIYLIRRAGLIVETVHEPHGGEYPGHHARYRLHSAVRVQELDAA